VLGLTGLGVSPASAASAASPTLDGGHHYGRSLFGTDGVKANDVWAVGLTPGDRAAAWHWDGAGWSKVRVAASPFSSVFVDVDARTTADAWAVGAQDPDGSGVRVAYVQHWDGHRWRATPADPDLFTSEANGVAARTARDVWVVGDGLQSPAGALSPFAEHWDGSTWRTVVTAKTDPACDAVLSDVSSVAADDVWAAGSVTCDGSSAPLVEHWNGKRWSRVDVPSPRRATYADLSGITALAADDIWAVGSYSRGSDPSRNLTMHWNGQKWKVVASPNPGDSSDNEGLAAVSGTGASDVWAAGVSSGQSGVRPAMLHWDGAQWSTVAIPASGFDSPPGDGLYDVVALAKRSAVTVGIAKTRGESVEAGFIERWNGRRWSLD
jgi:hypothetical protein